MPHAKQKAMALLVVAFIGLLAVGVFLLWGFDEARSLMGYLVGAALLALAGVTLYVASCRK